jgi:hypothetical protein
VIGFTCSRSILPCNNGTLNIDILIDRTQRMVEGELIQLTFNGNRRITEADVLDIAKKDGISV